jgi:hypothetical protein
MAEVIEPLQLALGDHDGDRRGGRQHREEEGTGQIESVSLSLGG